MVCRLIADYHGREFHHYFSCSSPWLPSCSSVFGLTRHNGQLYISCWTTFMQVFCSAWVGSLQCLGTLRMSWTLASARCHRSTSSKEILFFFLSESVILLQKDKLTVQALWQSPDQYAWPRLWQLRRPRFVSSPSYQPGRPHQQH